VAAASADGVVGVVTGCFLSLPLASAGGFTGLRKQALALIFYLAKAGTFISSIHELKLVAIHKNS